MAGGNDGVHYVGWGSYRMFWEQTGFYSAKKNGQDWMGGKVEGGDQRSTGSRSNDEEAK